MKFYLILSVIFLSSLIPVFGESKYPSYFTMENGSENLAVTAEQGSIIQLPIHLKIFPEYESASINLSFDSDRVFYENPQKGVFQQVVPKIKTWVNPYYAEYHNNTSITNTVFVTIDSDVEPGTYVIDIIGNGQLKKTNSEEYTNIDAQAVGRITLDVVPHDSKITMSIGDRTVHMGEFCIGGEGFDQMCASGPTYEEYPIVISTKSKTDVILKASGIPSGAWLKFIPDVMSVDHGNATAKMILAGFEMPFLSSQESVPLTITAESQKDHSSGFVPIIKSRDITVIKSAEPIKLVNQITTNSNGDNFNVYGAVYDPENSKKSIDVKLEVLGIVQDSTVKSVPAWLKLDIPDSSFTLNAAEPYYFIIKATTKSAPLGLHNVAIKETIDGQEFVENVGIYIPEPIYTGTSGGGLQLGGPKSSEPIPPTEAVIRSSSEHVESGSPLISWDANTAIGMGVILSGIFGSITIVVILKSKSRQKY